MAGSGTMHSVRRVLKNRIVIGILGLFKASLPVQEPRNKNVRARMRIA